MPAQKKKYRNPPVEFRVSKPTSVRGHTLTTRDLSTKESAKVIAQPNFELPVRAHMLAAMFGWDPSWVREKSRKDSKRNRNPIPSHKPGKYLLFYPSEVNEWIKAA
jgi:hypothetical protein